MALVNSPLRILDNKGCLHLVLEQVSDDDLFVTALVCKKFYELLKEQCTYLGHKIRMKAICDELQAAINDAAFVLHYPFAFQEPLEPQDIIDWTYLAWRYGASTNDPPKKSALVFYVVQVERVGVVQRRSFSSAYPPCSQNPSQ